jgi:hypothetical protein
MASLVEWIEHELDGKDIVEAVVIGEYGWGSGWGKSAFHEEKCAKQIPWNMRGIALTWEQAKPLLDYEFSDGYGSPECHAIYVWSKDKVMWITQYDGSTTLSSMPRNPLNCQPDMPGG